MDIIDARSLAILAFENIRDDLCVEIPERLNDNDNLLVLLDSMDLVNLIMETESLIDSKLGKGVPLANEFTFDCEKSPFLTLNKWVEHIKIMIESSDAK